MPYSITPLPPTVTNTCDGSARHAFSSRHVGGDRLAQGGDAGERRVVRLALVERPLRGFAHVAGVSKSGSPIWRWMIERPCASSARARALTSNALSVPIVRMREATRRVDAVGIIEPPTAMEAEHHLRRSAASRP